MKQLRKDNHPKDDAQLNNFISKNKTVRKDNTSGYPGVCYEPRCQKWRAYIDLGKYKKSLGYFTRKEDAIKARQEAENKLK